MISKRNSLYGIGIIMMLVMIFVTLSGAGTLAVAQDDELTQEQVALQLVLAALENDKLELPVDYADMGATVGKAYATVLEYLTTYNITPSQSALDMAVESLAWEDLPKIGNFISLADLYEKVLENCQCQ